MLVAFLTHEIATNRPLESPLAPSRQLALGLDSGNGIVTNLRLIFPG